MKKHIYLLLLLAMVLFIPFDVFAASASLSLDCTNSIAKGGTITCKVKAVVTPTESEIAGEIVGTISGSNDVFSIASQNITSEDLTAIIGAGNDYSIAVKQDAVIGNATVTLNVTSFTDDGGNNITMQSATVTDTVKVLNDVSTIKSIKVDSTETSCKLTESSCTLDTVKKATIVIDATPLDTNATITGGGSKTLKCGNNTITLTSTAEDKVKKTNYTLNVNRSCNTDVTIKGIDISVGSLNPTFAATTKTYTVDVSKEVDKITIAATKNDTTQTITGTVKDKALNYGENKFVINVKSESGATGTYTITVNREDARDDNTYLSDITLSDGKIKFDKDIVEYKVKVLHDVTKITMEATPESETSKAVITNNNQTLKDGDNPAILITVTSEKGTTKIYKLTVTRLEEGETLGDNPNLATIKVDGYDLEFKADKLEYTLKIDDEKTLNIKYTVEEQGTEVLIKGNSNLKNGDVITLTSTSADGTTKDYKIVIEKSNNLIIIIIAAVVGLGAIAGIVVLLIKNKKDKDLLSTSNLKNQLKEEEMLKHVVEEPTIKETNNDFGPTTPLSINGSNLNNYNTTFKESNNMFDRVREEQQEERPVVLEDPEATRVCSICGHRVSASLKTCPYCKRSF